MFEEYFEEFDEENEYDNKYLFIGWGLSDDGSLGNYKNHFKNIPYGWFYVLQESNNKLYKDGSYKVSGSYEILSKEDMEKYIYSNITPLTIYIGPEHNNNDVFKSVYYKDLPDEVKNNH